MQVSRSGFYNRCAKSKAQKADEKLLEAAATKLFHEHNLRQGQAKPDLLCLRGKHVVSRFFCAALA